MAGHGYGRSWLWQVMVIAGHGYGRSWLWQVMVGHDFCIKNDFLLYNLQCVQARNLSTHLQELLKIIADSTINMRLNLQSTKGLVSPRF